MTNKEILRAIEEAFDDNVKAVDWQGRTAKVIGKDAFMSEMKRKFPKESKKLEGVDIPVSITRAWK
jgi:hypothetical protein